jgi:predicted AAA+ superfamily ATPase
LAKPTIKKYVEYLESAFLVMKIRTVDDNCRTMTRERNFKIYLNNPSMRAALFAPVDYADSTKIGHLAECAVFSQWQHSPNFGRLRYARWRNEGEVDVVFLGADDEKPSWIGEVKWSDRVQENAGREMRAVVALVKKHKSIKSAFFTTKTLTLKLPVEHITINVMPTALYCYMVGRNITSRLDAAAVIGEVPKVEKPKAEKPSKAE